MRDVIEKLSVIDWDDRQWRKQAIDILLGSDHNLMGAVSNYVKSWDGETRTARLNGSHETSTHYKWLIHRDADLRFTLWLHDYKSRSRRKAGYAQVPHNHRYDLCSIILSGGYESILYDVSGDISEINREALSPGGILSLGYDDVHALESIRDNTKSLFVEGPTMRNYSTAFPFDGEPCDFVDFDGRLPGLLDALDSAG